MPKVTEAYRTARRDEIIESALRCFAAKGYQRTSMADIIDESGLSAGAIYGHFSGKKELFSAVAGRVVASGGTVAISATSRKPAQVSMSLSRGAHIVARVARDRKSVV